VARRAARPKRLGSEVPRIYTPPLRELTPETSLGFSVIEFADEVLQINLLPWQRWLLIHMLELLPDNSLRFRTVVVLVARQNGKSTLSQVLALWAMYVYGWPLILGTAQDLDTAEEVWQGAVDLVTEVDDEEEPVRPDLFELLDRVVMVNGKKSLNIKTGERYKVKAANRRAGRGLSGDLVLLDELREHQSWDAWGAITKTTIARAMALILALSNAGDSTSIVLAYLRKMAHAAIGDPDGINAEDHPGQVLVDEEPDEDVDDVDEDTLGLFEWSAPPGCPVGDRDGWAMANPSLGYTITERTLASAARTDPEWVFRTECLCQWAAGSLEGIYPPGKWDACLDKDSKLAADTPIGLCVDVAWDRSASHIAIAGRRDDGLLHVEIIASRAGTEWVLPWLTSAERSEAIRSGWVGGPDGPKRETFGPPVAIQASGAPASSLIDELRAGGVDVVDWRGGDLGGATGLMYDRVRDETVRHRVQPILDVAVATAAAKPLGDSWVIDRRKSAGDAAPLNAVIGAAWLVAPKPQEPAKNPQVHAWPDDLLNDEEIIL
jgi:hypothetical protein